MKLEHLVYVSVSTAQPPLEALIAEIQTESVRNNAPNNLTGVLTWTGTRFIQILEGSPGSLDVLLLKLICDPRHHDMDVMDRRPIRERSFGRWAMIAPETTPVGRQRLGDLLQAGERSLDVWEDAMRALVEEQEAVSIGARGPSPL